MIPKYKQLKKEIEEKEISLQEDKIMLKKICPHAVIQEDVWSSDEWAHRTYDCVSYKCIFCGLYASSTFIKNDKEEKQVVFEKLKDKYNKQQRKKWKWVI